MLKARITADEFNALPDSDKAHYKATDDGTYTCQIEPVAWMDGDAAHKIALEDVGALTSALSRLKTQVAEGRTQLDGLKSILGDLDPQEAVDAVAKLKSLGDLPAGGDIKKELETRTEAIREALEKKNKSILDKMVKEKDDLAKRLADAQAVVKVEKIDNAAIRAIETEKGNVKVLLPHVVKRCQCIQDDKGEYIVQVLDQQGNPAYNTDANPMGIADLVKEFKQSSDYDILFEGSNQRGSNTTTPTNRGSRAIVLNAADAKDPGKYRAAKEAAAKAGQELQIAGVGAE